MIGLRNTFCIVTIKINKIIGLIILFIIFVFIISFRIKENKVIEVVKPQLSEELFKQMTITLLMPSVNAAIENYYKEYLNYAPTDDPWFIKISKTEKVKDNTYEFLVKVELTPYIGPHNSVGLDHITFRIMPWGEVILEKYEHIESYPIAPNWSNIIIKWPPDEGSYIK